MKYVLHKFEGINSIINQSIEDISSDESAIIKVALQELQNKSLLENWHNHENLKYKQDLINQLLDSFMIANAYVREIDEAEEVNK